MKCGSFFGTVQCERVARHRGLHEATDDGRLAQWGTLREREKISSETYRRAVEKDLVKRERTLRS